VFRWRFPSRLRLRFRWLLLSKQGLRALPKQHVTFLRFLSDDFQAAPTPFSLTFSESIRAGSSSESTRHLWKLFRWWFLSRQQLSFCWLFLSEEGLCVSWIQASFVEGVSVRIFQPALTLFLLTFSKSTGDASASVSTRHLWKLFRWRFASQHRLHFCRLLLSQQRPTALPNPRVTIERCFGYDFWVDNKVFVDYFSVNRDCRCWRINVSVRIFQPALTPFSFTFSESTGAGSSSESTRQFWKVFRWQFPSQHRFHFCLTFSESKGAASSSESMRHLWKLFPWWFPSQHRLHFHWLFLSQQGQRPLPNPRVTFGICFGDDFPVSTDSVFVDFFLVNRGWQLFRIHSSPLKGVSVLISERQQLSIRCLFLS